MIHGKPKVISVKISHRGGTDMSKRTKFFITLGAVFLVVGVPIIINECYKANCGYKTDHLVPVPGKKV